MNELDLNRVSGTDEETDDLNGTNIKRRIKVCLLLILFS